MLLDVQIAMCEKREGELAAREREARRVEASLDVQRLEAEEAALKVRGSLLMLYKSFLMLLKSLLMPDRSLLMLYRTLLMLYTSILMLYRSDLMLCRSDLMLNRFIYTPLARISRSLSPARSLARARPLSLRFVHAMRNAAVT